MTQSLAFDEANIQDDPQLRAMKELNDFLTKPHSIGLDNLKESLRNMIQLMMELKGYKTGYQVHHLVRGEHSSLAMAGVLESDEEKKKRIRRFYEMLEEIEKDMARQFAQVFSHVSRKVKTIKSNIKDQIEELDDRIEEMAETPEQATAIKRASKKRKTLVSFHNHITEHEEDLEEAANTAEIIAIEEQLNEDLQDFQQGTFDANQPKRSKLSVFGDWVRDLREGFKKEAPEDTDFSYGDNFTSLSNNATIGIERWQQYNHFNYSSHDDDTSSGEEDTGSGDDDESQSDDEDIAPPSHPEF